MEKTREKLKERRHAVGCVARWKAKKQKIVFTNGCFDILHLGHVSYLEQAKTLGDRLVVGLNTDRSISSLKGINRPIQDQRSRAFVLASLQAVDMVVLFDEKTPLSLISELIPDVLVKGGDYVVDEIVGMEIVRNNNGVVKIMDLMPGYSTSAIVEKIRKT